METGTHFTFCNEGDPKDLGEHPSENHAGQFSCVEGSADFATELARQHRVKVLQDYLHHQPHQCRVLRFQANPPRWRPGVD